MPNHWRPEGWETLKEEAMNKVPESKFVFAPETDGTFEAGADAMLKAFVVLLAGHYGGSFFDGRDIFVFTQEELIKLKGD